MLQLQQKQSMLAALRLDVMLVTFDEREHAQEYIAQTGWPWPLLLDRERQAYQAYGMSSGSWWAIANPLSIARYVGLMLRGRRLQKSGEDYRQLGGDVLIDPQQVIRMHHASANPHDRPSVNTILDRYRRGLAAQGNSDAAAIGE